MLLVLCDAGHRDVCYDGAKPCPVCEKIEQIHELENEIAYLKDRISTLRDSLCIYYDKQGEQDG